MKEANLTKLRAVFSGSSAMSEAELVLLLAPFAANESLPPSLCSEVVAWGGSEALLEAIVKKGCRAVSSADLGKLVAKIKARREEADERERGN